jgi:uncharacterized membrane protein
MTIRVAALLAMTIRVALLLAMTIGVALLLAMTIRTPRNDDRGLFVLVLAAFAVAVKVLQASCKITNRPDSPAPSRRTGYLTSAAISGRSAE